MKTIGMLGGMSWESTLSYYRSVNEGVKQKLGGLHSAKICMISVDFEEIEALQHEGKWHEAGDLLAGAARSIEAGGADFLVICTNTMHKVAPQIEASISIPLLHIADATGDALREDGIGTVALLGTKFVMSEEFYKDRIKEKYGIDVLVPDEEDQNTIHGVIYDELCLGKIEAESKRAFVGIIETLGRRGAQAVILGCTEIGLLVQQNDTGIPVYDTAAIHAARAVDMALS